MDSCLFLYLENHRFNKLGCDTKESCNYVALCIGLKSSSARILACFEGESESKTKFLFWHFVLHRCSEQNTLFLLYESLVCRFYIQYTVLLEESRVEEQPSWNTMLAPSPASRSILQRTNEKRDQANTRRHQRRRMPHCTNVGTQAERLMSQIHTNKPVSRFTKQSGEQKVRPSCTWLAKTCVVYTPVFVEELQGF